MLCACVLTAVLGVALSAPSSKYLFSYGNHFPHGIQAVEYVTGPQGLWRAITPAEYTYNYYDHPAPVPANHPFNTSGLVAYADGTHFTTCRDANGHLLLDINHDGEIDSVSAGYAYFEHAARGTDNVLLGTPFTNFWFDDNSLAKFMNLAYGLPVPDGLSQYADFTRWQIVGGDNAYWTPYSAPGAYIDQLALNGLYYLSLDPPQIDHAYRTWSQILVLSAAVYNSSTQQYDYPGVREAYHLSLWMTLTQFLRPFYASSPENNVYHHPERLESMENDDAAATANLLLQHWVAQRSLLLTYQVVDRSSLSSTSTSSAKSQAMGSTKGSRMEARKNAYGLKSMSSPPASTPLDGPFCGWTSTLRDDDAGGHSLMNAESAAMGVLALSAGALYRYEVQRSPLLSDASTASFFFRNEYNVLSAVVGLSTPNQRMVYGPYLTLPTSTGETAGADYEVELLVRMGSIPTSIAPSAALLDISLCDASQLTTAKNATTKETKISGRHHALPTTKAHADSCGRLVKQFQVTVAEVQTNQWTAMVLPLVLSAEDAAEIVLNVEVRWTGLVNVDLSVLTLR